MVDRDIEPPVTVEVLDSSGRRVTDFDGDIRLSIGNNPGGGALEGETTEDADDGIAEFDDLSINRTGIGYTLIASANQLTPDTSVQFDITAGAADGEESTITADPTSIPADGVSTSTITVELRDDDGNRLTEGGDTVTLSTTLGTLGPVTDNADGTYTAILTAGTTVGSAIVNGEVNDDEIEDTATVTLTQPPIQPTGLAFGVQPSDTPAGATISPPVTVRAVDASGNTAPLFTGAITIAIGANPGGGTLAGTTTRTAVLGVATFDDLSIERAGAGYTLVASASGLSSATSAPFDIAPGPASGATSTITADPTAIPADGVSTSTITVQLKDAFGNDLTSGGDAVTLSTTAGSLGPVTDSGDGTYTAVLTSPTTGGAATITGQVNGTAITDNAGVMFAQQSGAQATALGFVVNPSNTRAGVAIVPAIVVRAVDASGTTDADFTGTITISIGNNPAGGSLSGTISRDAVNGIATFDGLSIAQAGNGYTLVASASGLRSDTSLPFNITAAAASGASSEITADPSAIAADGASTSTITVRLRDSFGNSLTSGGDAVTLSTTAGSLGSVTDLRNGRYTATLTSSTTAETATITGTVNGQPISDNATVAFALGSADLSIDVSVSDPSPVEGGTVVYMVTVTNNGPDAATGVEISDDLAGPSTRMSFVSANATSGTYDSAVGVWRLERLESGDSAILLLTVRVIAD